MRSARRRPDDAIDLSAAADIENSDFWEDNTRTRRTKLAAIVAAAAMWSCTQPPAQAPAEEAAPAATSAPVSEPKAATIAAPLAYIVSQHSPLLSAEARMAVGKDFQGVPLNGARAKHEVTAERVRCRTLNPPSGVPECSVTYAGQEVATTGEDATALFAALQSAGVEPGTAMGHVTLEIAALQCTVDDAVAQDTPSTGDNVAGFSCGFTPV